MKKKKIGIIVLSIGIICMIFGLVGCKISPDDLLKISSFSPRWILSHIPFTLTINGEGFKPDSVIVFNNIEMETGYVGSNALQCRVTAEQTALSPAANSVNVRVFVKSSPGSEKQSNAFNFQVKHRPEFSPPGKIYEITANDFQARSLKLMINEKPRLYMIWKEYIYESEVGYQDFIKLSTSGDSGESWSEARDIPAGDFPLARNGNLYAWNVSNHVIKLHRSGDTGDSWTAADVQVLDENKDFNGYQVFCDENNTLLLVYGETDNNYNMTLTTLESSYNGETWDLWQVKGQNNFLCNGDIYNLEWLSANNSGGICVGYYYPYGRYGMTGQYLSFNGGVTFEERHGGYDDFLQGILTDEGKFYVLYNGMVLPYTYKIYFYKGLEYGAAPLKQLELEEAYYYGPGDMVMDGWGNLYIAWNNVSIRSIDDGENWTDAAAFSESGNMSNHSLAIDNDSLVHLAWTNPSGLYFTTIKTAPDE